MSMLSRWREKRNVRTEELCAAADQLLQDMKNAGRGEVVSIDPEVMRFICSELRKATKHDGWPLEISWNRALGRKL